MHTLGRRHAAEEQGVAARPRSDRDGVGLDAVVDDPGDARVDGGRRLVVGDGDDRRPPADRAVHVAGGVGEGAMVGGDHAAGRGRQQGPGQGVVVDDVEVADGLVGPHGVL